MGGVDIYDRLLSFLNLDFFQKNDYKIFFLFGQPLDCSYFSFLQLYKSAAKKPPTLHLIIA